MKKQVALVLAGTAAGIAGGLRLIQELVERHDRQPAGTGSHPEQEPPSPAASANGKPHSESAATGPARANRSASKADLYEIATELKISGRSKMSKAELIEAINRVG